MSTPESKVVIGIDLLLKRLGPTLKGLDSVEKKLRSVASIRLPTKATALPQFDRAAAAAQKLSQQQQRLAVQSQELANRQERARQASERLTQSQQRLMQASERLATAQRKLGNAPAPDAHVRFFKQTQKAAQDADKHVQFFRANEAALKKAPQVDAHVRAFKAIQKGADDADKHVKFFKATEGALKKAPQVDSHVQAFRALEASAKRARTETEKLEAQKRRLARTSDTLDRSLSKIGGTLSRVGNGLQSFGRTLSVALTAPLAALGIVAVDSAKDIDAQVNTLKAFVGGADEAEKRLKQLIETARQTPGLTTSLGLMLDAQLRLANTTVETIDKVLPAIGRLNAVQKLDDPAKFAQNLVQLVTQNFEKIDLKELVGQSPVAGQIIAQMFNVDSPTNGKAIREAAKKMGLTTTDAFFTAFADAAAKNQALGTVTESIGSRLAKQADRLTFALRPLGLAILDAITPAINALIPFVEKLSTAFANLPKPAQQALLVIGGLAALLGPALIVVGSLVTAVGGLVTAFGAIAGAVAAVGLPAIAAAVGGIVIIIGEWVAILTALGLAWKTNFLNIRGLITTAATAVLAAFGRIRAIFNEFVQRVLPTLQSISTKVIGVITAAWEKYGKDIVDIVGFAFRFITEVTETFLRVFTNFVDLILKLIDGDFKGAWSAFARILLSALDGWRDVMNQLNRVAVRAFALLVKFILDQSIVMAEAGRQLAASLLTGIAVQIVAGFPQVKDALLDMLLLAVLSINPATIAQTLIARFIAALRRAAEESSGAAPVPSDETTWVRFRPLKPNPKPPTVTETDKKGERALRKAQDDLAKAQNDFQEAQEESQLALLRQRIDNEFELAKDGLDREQSALEDSFQDRLVAVKRYFEDRRALQERALDAELVKEHNQTVLLFKELSARRRSIEKDSQAEIEAINRDPALKGRAKQIAIQAVLQKKATEEEKAIGQFKTQNEAVQTRVNILEKKRGDIIRGTTRDQSELTKELQKQADSLAADLFEERGATSDAAAIRLRQQFKDTLSDLKVDATSLAPELQRALNNVDLKTLKSRLQELPEPVKQLIELLEIGFNRAILVEQSVKVDRTLSELHLRETDIQNKVLDGVISERDARAQIVGLQQASKARLLDILAAQLAIARATPGQEDEVLRLQSQIQEVQRLGVVIDDVAQEINRSLTQNIESGFASIFDSALEGFDGLKSAAESFGKSFLSILNQLASRKLTQELFGDLFNPETNTQTGTKGTAGGFISKLFGLAPKKPDIAGDSALASASTTAGTALATGGTSAATALTTGGTAAAAALTTGSTAASATLLTSITSAAASFAAIVSGAAATFAATVSAAAGAQSVGGLGSAFGAAEGGLFSPQPGGRLGVFAEAGYSEAILTTDPKYASRQAAILHQYLRETKGLFGRIPQFAAGDFISPRQTELDLLSSIHRTPSVTASIPEAALASAGSGTAAHLNLRQVLVWNERDLREALSGAPARETLVTNIGRDRVAIRRILGIN